MKIFCKIIVRLNIGVENKYQMFEALQHHLGSPEFPKLGHLPLTSRGKVRCEALSSPTKLWIFRIFDFNISDFRFLHFDVWLDNWPFRTFFYIIIIRLTHLDMCLHLISILNAQFFWNVLEIEWQTFFTCFVCFRLRLSNSRPHLKSTFNTQKWRNLTSGNAYQKFYMNSKKTSLMSREMLKPGILLEGDPQK